MKPCLFLHNVFLRFQKTLIISLILLAEPVHANLWDDLWQTSDQQAKKAFDKKDYKQASKLFNNKQWQGASEYKQQNYKSAIESFSQLDDVDSLYNTATSLAKNHQFKEAEYYYEQVLKKSPQHQDAMFNKKLVRAILDKQEQEKKDQEKKDQQDQQDQQDQKNSEQQSDQESEKSKSEKSESDGSKAEESNPEQAEDAERKIADEQSEEEKSQPAKLTQDQRNDLEKEQALEHWLEKIPDDPGGLLRRKMYREYQRRNGQQTEDEIW